MRYVALATAFLIAACAMTGASSSGRTAEVLTSASTAADARRAVHRVLRDVLDGRYAMDDTARRAAFDAIARFRLTGELDNVRAIAGLPVSQTPERRLLDIVAVSGALNALTALDPAAAIGANIRRLSDDDLTGFAALNLLQLRAWDATGAVEDALSATSLDITHARDVAMLLSFLDEAPNLSANSCAAARRVEVAYRGDCSVHAYSFCAELNTLSASIAHRSCGDR